MPLVSAPAHRAAGASGTTGSVDPGRRATSEATAPGSIAAATIRSFSARDQRRRRCTDVITSTAFVIGLVLVIVLGLAANLTPARRPSPEAYEAIAIRHQGLAHPMDQFAQLTADRGPPCPSAGFPAPIGAKSCTMPPQHRVRLNDPGQPEQAWPEPGHPYQQRPIAAALPRPARCTPQGDVELVTKKEILDLQLPPRLEQVGDEHRKQMENGKHRKGCCPDSPSGANPRGWDFRERHVENEPHDRFIGQRAGVPGVPVALHLAPHPAHRVLADRAAEQGRERTAHPARVGAGEIACPRSARRRPACAADKPAAPGSSTPSSCHRRCSAWRAAPRSRSGRTCRSATASGCRGGGP